MTSSDSQNDLETDPQKYVHVSILPGSTTHCGCQVEDPRLDCAILRPMESDGDHFLAYYLTKEDEAAISFKEERLARDPNAPEEDEVRTSIHELIAKLTLSSSSAYLLPFRSRLRSCQGGARCAERVLAGD